MSSPNVAKSLPSFYATRPLRCKREEWVSPCIAGMMSLPWLVMYGVSRWRKRAEPRKVKPAMTSAPPITTLFVDVGNVLLTDSWGPLMRQKAVDTFGIDISDVAKRSQLTFEGYEEGKMTLDEYLTWVVFHEDRSFSRAALTEFMLAQSEAHPEMLDLMRTLKTRYGLKIVVVTNDGREFIVHRIQRFGLKEFVDFFVVSCFVQSRKPETRIYQLALDMVQVDPKEVAYIDDQILFVEVAESLGLHGIHHTSYASTRAALAAFGLS
jgi:putative hydrolase of the HAD superfamily